jgi:hypothetical protein
MDGTLANRSDGGRLRGACGRWLLVLLFLVGASGTPLSPTLQSSPDGAVSTHLEHAGQDRPSPSAPIPTDHDDHAACLACVLLLFPVVRGRERTPVGAAPAPHRARYEEPSARLVLATSAEARAPPG